MKNFCTLLIAFWVSINVALTKTTTPSESAFQISKNLDMKVRSLMKKGRIPGMSVALVKGERLEILTFGFADEYNEVPVDPSTLFQLGSTSKAFTALAFRKVAAEYQIAMHEPVSKFIPWLTFTFNDQPVEVTLEQLMHHTSGIPWNTIADIPVAADKAALEKTIRTLENKALDHLPGSKYLYATINYDVLALILETVTGKSFESYLQEEVLAPLGLERTTIGTPMAAETMSGGFKSGFFKARPYKAPTYRGNNAAGYVISDVTDLARWLQFQMGTFPDHPLYAYALKNQERDKSVPLHHMAAYGEGWNILLDGSDLIYHDGLNPNFSSYIAFSKSNEIGVVVLTNANSNYTNKIGQLLINSLNGNEEVADIEPGDGGDRLFSLLSVALALYVLIVFGVLVRGGSQLLKGSRKPFPFSKGLLFRMLIPVWFLMPFAIGLNYAPSLLLDFTWEAVLVWSPFSLGWFLKMLGGAIGMSYLAYLFGLFFPEANAYKRKAPLIVLISVLSGLANVGVIILVTSAIGSDVKPLYLSFYYLLIIGMYLLGRRFVQISLIRFARGLVYELRYKLIQKVFSTSFEKFEKVDRGRIYTTLNDDVNLIGQSTNVFVTLITSLITGIGAFCYLAFIAFWATAIIVLVIATLATLYYFVSRTTHPYFNAARDSRNVFMELINGMIDGFKETSLKRQKKIEFRDDLAASALEYKEKISTADIKFTNAFLVGESLLVVLLGMTAIGMSEVFPDIQVSVIMSFVVVLLYLIGPINGILNSVPYIMQLRIAWQRVQQFIRELPANLDLDQKAKPVRTSVDRLELRNVTFSFDKVEGFRPFTLGPINLSVEQGQILFIVGGNGSGKTTLAKILTGLYPSDQGDILINGQETLSKDLGEYYSTTFTVPHLFKKLYAVDTDRKKAEISHFLEMMELDKKVQVENGQYSTINLSSGQRKRLSLLQCYLEDSPIFLFDEWAADQDPGFRRIFYRKLLPEMRKMGKIVIAITHDDHYFDVADKVLKLDQGRLYDFKDEMVWGEVPVIA